MKLKITGKAKKKAQQALKLRRSLPEKKKFGLTKKEAEGKGIASGVQRAKQLIESESISLKDAKRVAAFYQRFKGCRTKKCEGAINLWGGRSFGKKAVKHAKKFY